MKKTLIASAIAVTVFSSANARADIAVTNMFLLVDLAAEGSLTNAGDGSINSIDPFKGIPWNASQATTFMDTSGSFAGSNGMGAWDYSAEIAAMTADQVAVGLFFDWNGNNAIPVLEIFNCTAGICTGQGVPMATNPFKGSTAIFSGTGDTAPHIPVPAAVWLMGSGLIGLMGIARRRKRA